MRHRTKANQQRKTFSLLMSAVLTICLFMGGQLSAVEITPADKINPEELQPSFQPIGDANELTQSNSMGIATDQNQTKPTWWSWLTNSSRKPASFHFIDIIELLA